MKMKNRDTALAVHVKRDKLIIEIGVDVLKHAAANHPQLYDFDTSKPHNIGDAQELAEDISRELQREEEDGSSSPISDLIDAMVMKAYEDGSTAFYEPEE